MFEKGIIFAILKSIAWSLSQIAKRFEPIYSSSDFQRDDAGSEKLDSICMQLINIGEALKQLDKLTAGKLLANYPEIDWKKAKGLRDIIAHHYFDIDAETVYVVCSEHVPEMKRAIEKMLKDVEQDISTNNL
jgi:uncharacterized protein with HEPN domain